MSMELLPKNLKLQHGVPILCIGDLHLTPSQYETYWPLLSADEKTRASKFHFEKDRMGYVASRGTLRVLLATQLAITPSEIVFHYSNYGKPTLPEELGVYFNVSHSGSKMLIGFSNQVPIGVDIEHIEFKADLDQVARRFFSAHEVADYFALSDTQRKLGFFNCWTRKESFIKAVGHGLSFPLDQFTVSLHPDKEAQLLDTAFDLKEKTLWTLKSIAGMTNYAMAFSLRCPIDAYRLFSVQHEELLNWLR